MSEFEKNENQGSEGRERNNDRSERPDRRKTTENKIEIVGGAMAKKVVRPAAQQGVRVRKLGDQFVGRRKTSVARVKLTKGTGKIVINGKPIEQYFPLKTWQTTVVQPLVLLNKMGEYDLKVNVYGGGVKGQVDAVRLGLARGLDSVEPNSHQELRKAGLLTRDARSVERKKYGFHKARRGVQFSKR